MHGIALYWIHTSAPAVEASTALCGSGVQDVDSLGAKDSRNRSAIKRDTYGVRDSEFVRVATVELVGLYNLPPQSFLIRVSSPTVVRPFSLSETAMFFSSRSPTDRIQLSHVGRVLGRQCMYESLPFTPPSSSSSGDLTGDLSRPARIYMTA